MADVMDKKVEDMDVREKHMWLMQGRLPRTVVERGTISISEIDTALVAKYNLKVGMLTPATRLRITE